MNEDIGPHTKLAVRLTHRFKDSSTPIFEGTPARLTVRQALARYREMKRGGAFVGIEAFHGSRSVFLTSLEELGSLFEASAAW